MSTNTQEIKSVEIASCVRVAMVLYAGLGLIAGALMALVSLIGGLMPDSSGMSGPFWGMFAGVGAIVVLPVFYAVVGAIAGMVGGFLYNVCAGWVGGIELNLRAKPEASSGAPVGSPPLA